MSDCLQIAVRRLCSLLTSRQALSSRDRDGTGYITTEDLAAVMRSHGVVLAPHDVDDVVQGLGVPVDGFGKLDYRRFLNALKVHLVPGVCGRELPLLRAVL